jgi:hypothetical protein
MPTARLQPVGDRDRLLAHVYVDSGTGPDAISASSSFTDLDHQQLIYRRNGLAQSLFDNQTCGVVKDILA